jgi:hypothetical protein
MLGAFPLWFLAQLRAALLARAETCCITKCGMLLCIVVCCWLLARGCWLPRPCVRPVVGPWPACGRLLERVSRPGAHFLAVVS